MSFTYPSLPSVRDYTEEKADYWELQAVRNSGSFISRRHVSRDLGIELNELDHEGIESEDDLLDGMLDEVLLEINRRADILDGKYPFIRTKYSIQLTEDESFFKDIYLFLLLSTRLNMKNNRVLNSIDAGLLFEHLCTHVIRNYFGENARSKVFGTGTSGNFEKKVSELIKDLGIKGVFTNPDNNSVRKRDDGVDIVAWKEFADRREGKLIAFGQCKTGVKSWRDGRLKLNPHSFCKKWLSESPVFDPIPILFISDTLTVNNNYYTDQEGQLVFNRFRILEYLTHEINDNADLISDIREWTNEAFAILQNGID